MSSSQVYLKKARYGKDKVKVMKVYRDGEWQTCVELTVSSDVYVRTEKWIGKLIKLHMSIGCPYFGRRH
jgi:hypothetical protein